MKWLQMLFRFARQEDRTAPGAPQADNMHVMAIDMDQPDTRTEVEPPWVAYTGYPRTEIWWTGWRQGSSEDYIENE